MYVCVYVCLLRICMCMWVYACVRARVRACVRACVCVRVHVNVCFCEYKRTIFCLLKHLIFCIYLPRWRINCEQLQSVMCHDSFIRVAWPIHTCGMTHVCLRLDSGVSLICHVPWLVHTCGMTHTCQQHDTSVSNSNMRCVMTRL